MSARIIPLQGKIPFDARSFSGKWTWNGRADWQLECDKMHESIKKLNRQRRKAINKGRRNRAKNIDVRVDALKAEIVAITLANK
jgi:hypothetical protein